jgi:hypothetical protein
VTRKPGPSNTTWHRHGDPTSQEWAGIRELRREVSELRRVNEPRGPEGPSSVGRRHSGSESRRTSEVRSRRARRRLLLTLRTGVAAIVLAATINPVLGSSDSFPLPSEATLVRLSMRERIAAIATSQVGYSTDPSNSYCNKFSTYWDVGTTDCPNGETSEEWCADFAAWAWQKAGVRFTYGYSPREINAGAVSFYEWGRANDHWHPATSGYRAVPGDVAVYGLSLRADPSAAHAAIVTDDPPGQRGPDVVNGDGDRAGFSVVETGTDQLRADTADHQYANLAGYVSPP